MRPGPALAVLPGYTTPATRKRLWAPPAVAFARDGHDPTAEGHGDHFHRVYEGTAGWSSAMGAMRAS